MNIRAIITAVQLAIKREWLEAGLITGLLIAAGVILSLYQARQRLRDLHPNVAAFYAAERRRKWRLLQSWLLKLFRRRRKGY